MTDVKEVVQTAGGCLGVVLIWLIGFFISGVFALGSILFVLWVINICCG